MTFWDRAQGGGGGAGVDDPLVDPDDDTVETDDIGDSDYGDHNGGIDRDVLVGILGDSWEVGATAAGHYIDKWAKDYYDEHGVWPDARTLWELPGFMSGAQRIPIFADLLPPAFRTVDENGNVQYWSNTGAGGPVPITGTASGAAIGILAGGNTPSYSLAYVQNLLQFGRPPPRGPGGARGPTFDRTDVIENTRNYWRSIMLEDPRNAEDLADQYITEASAFYRQGGQLQFDTWLKEKMRKTSKYATLYGRKPDAVTEEQYLAQYTGIVGQFGLGAEDALAELRTGLQSGASTRGFSERVSGTRRVQQANQGSLSQGIGNALRGLGSAVRA